MSGQVILSGDVELEVLRITLRHLRARNQLEREVDQASAEKMAAELRGLAERSDALEALTPQARSKALALIETLKSVLAPV